MTGKGGQEQRVQRVRIRFAGFQKRVQYAIAGLHLVLYVFAVEQGQRLTDGGTAIALRVAWLHALRTPERVQHDAWNFCIRQFTGAGSQRHALILVPHARYLRHGIRQFLGGQAARLIMRKQFEVNLVGFVGQRTQLVGTRFQYRAEQIFQVEVVPLQIVAQRRA